MIRREILTLHAIGLLALATAILGGCDNEGNLVAPDGRRITVTVVNADDQAAHLFVGNEDFPCCRVEPGASRTSNVTRKVGEFVIVGAGRNGVRLLNGDCNVTQAHFDSRAMRTTFTGNGWACG